MLYLAIAVTFAVFAAVASAADQGLPSQKVVVMGVDGLSASAAYGSSAFQEIARRSQVTYRGIVAANTFSRASWPELFQGSWQPWNKRNNATWPTLFGHFKSVASEKKLWYLGSYMVAVRAAGADTYGDFWRYRLTMRENIDTFVRTTTTSRSTPDLLISYTVQLDSAGHKHGWDTEEYNQTREEIGNEILRFMELYPEYTVYIVSDHGGRGGGHGLTNNRDLSRPESGVDSPFFRNVPFFRHPSGSNETAPLCYTVYNYELVALVAADLGVPPHPSWPRKDGGQYHGCQLEDIAPFVMEDISGADAVTTIGWFGAAFLILLLFVV